MGWAGDVANCHKGSGANGRSVLAVSQFINSDGCSAGGRFAVAFLWMAQVDPGVALSRRRGPSLCPPLPINSASPNEKVAGERRRKAPPLFRHFFEGLGITEGSR